MTLLVHEARGLRAAVSWSERREAFVLAQHLDGRALPLVELPLGRLLLELRDEHGDPFLLHSEVGDVARAWAFKTSGERAYRQYRGIRDPHAPRSRPRRVKPSKAEVERIAREAREGGGE